MLIAISESRRPRRALVVRFTSHPQLIHDPHSQCSLSSRRAGHQVLAATKAVPKEMLPVVDRRLIQHVVDEAREAGIEHFIFVTGRNKAVIEDRFDRQFELEPHAHGAPAARRSRGVT